jgi:hypothetical protein
MFYMFSDSIEPVKSTSPDPKVELFLVRSGAFPGEK